MNADADMFADEKFSKFVLLVLQLKLSSLLCDVPVLFGRIVYKLVTTAKLMPITAQLALRTQGFVCFPPGPITKLRVWAVFIHNVTVVISRALHCK